MRLIGLSIAVMVALVALGPMGPRGDLHAQVGPNAEVIDVDVRDDPSTLPPDVRPATDAESLRYRQSMAEADAARVRGDHPAAERSLRVSLTIREATFGPGHPVTGIALNDLAANLEEQFRDAESEPFYRRALAIFEARLEPDHGLRAMALTGLASSIESQGRLAEAEPLYRRALSIFEVRYGADHPVAAMTLGNLANNLENQGRIRDAEGLYRRALEMTEARLGSDHRYVGMNLNVLATNLEAQGRAAEAEPLRRRALKISETRSGIGHPDTAVRVESLARNLAKQGRVVDAEPHYRRALAIYEIRLGIDHPDYARSLNGLALNLQAQGRATAAMPLFQRAVAVYEARLGPDHLSTATVLGNLADNMLIQNRVTEAVEYTQRATAILNARLGPGHYNTASARSGFSRGFLKYGHADLALVEARAALRTWDIIADSANASAPEATRAAMLADQRFGATMVMQAAWRVHSSTTATGFLDEAFDASQRLSASGASDALTLGAARTAAAQAGAGNAVAAWHAIQTKIATIDAGIASAAYEGAPGDAQRLRLAEERTRAVATLAEAHQHLATRFPRYFDLIKAPPISVADLQATTGDKSKLLRTDEAVVVLTPGADWMPEGHRNGLVFVVTKTTSAWAEIPLSPKELKLEIGVLHKSLVDAATIGADSVPFPRNHAHRLFSALFGAPAITEALAGKDRWLLAPQGSLMSLPFAALVMAEPQGDDTDDLALRGTPWLGLNRTLAVLPSVSALRLQRLYALDRGSQQRTPFFGLGDPAFQGVADAGARGGVISGAPTYFRGASADLSQLALLPRLPGTAAEIRGLAEILGAGPGSYVLQVDASEAELRRRNASGALERAEIVAFATHGLLAGDLAFLSEPALALTPPVLRGDVQVNSDNDGLLTASEAATLRLSASFVILSACNTAAGGGPDADALSGLARAFLYAGAQSLLVSHYPIFDDAGMRLTTEAARIAHTTEIRNPEAMRQSMAALMNDRSADSVRQSFAHPVYWAPFAVIDAN